MRGKLSGLFVSTSLLAFVVIALVLRIIPRYSELFTGGWVKFTSPDTYFFMRQVDQLAYNFPNLMTSDPYFALSGGISVGELNLFVYLLGTVAWLFGAGSPTPEAIDMVGMYFPVALGALTLVPGYFLGKALFNRWGGVLTAGLLAVMPGEYLGRTALGSADRDCLQVFLVVVTMLFTALAVKCASENELFNRGFSREDRRPVVQAAVYGLLAGMSLGLFLLTWKGAFIFSAVILGFIIVQSVIDCLRGRPAHYLFFTGMVIFLSALLIFLPFVQNTTYRASIILELITVIAAALASWAVTKLGWRTFIYPVILVVLAAAMLGVAYLAFPTIVEQVKLSLFGSLSLTALDQTVTESRSILFPAGQFTLYSLWFNYTTGFYLSLIAIGILIYPAIKNSRPLTTFLLLWSITILLLTLMMRRFAVFYTVNAALLAAYCCLEFLKYLGIIKPTVISPGRQSVALEKSGRGKKTPGPSRSRAPVMSVVLGMLTILLLVFMPNIPTAVFVSGTLPYVPSNAWCESLDWLKKNTPDPYGNPGFYYEDYTKTASDKYLYPGSAYAVTAWWDYGYWIVRTAHRLPNCHPGGGNREQVARFFLDQDTESAYKKAADLRSRYVMLDYHTVTGMYDSVMLYAGIEREKFLDGYYRPIPGTSKLEPVVMYHPAYYRSLAVRLYNFDGAAVTSKSCRVIAWEERMSVEGKYKHLVGSRDFPVYKEAEAFIADQKSGNYSIVSEDPFKSPVPLEAVSGYRLAYISDSKTRAADGAEMPEVKVFEYIK